MTDNPLPDKLFITLNGQRYQVDVAYDANSQNNALQTASAADSNNATPAVGTGEEITAPLEGKFYRVKNAQETPKNVGDSVQKGDIIGYIEAMKTYNAIRAEFDGVITAFVANAGDSVEEDDVLMKIARK